MMKSKEFFHRAFLALAAAVLFLASSCTNAAQDIPESSIPVMNSSAAPSTAVHAPSSSPPLIPPLSPSETGSKIPGEWRDGGLFADYYDKAYAMLETMTVEEKISQMLLVRCPQANAPAFIGNAQPGGLVLFEVDFRDKTADDVISMIETYQDAANIPMIMATDEEGGSVVRISRNPMLSDHIFQSPQKLYLHGGLEAVREDALIKAALLKKLGLNLLLAPVADVSVNHMDYIYPRTLGQPADETGRYVAAVVSAMREMNMSSALKHFPGYGSNLDTHTGIALDNRPYSAFADSDYIPFEKGIAAGAESILVSHNIIECLDKGVPASLSKAVHQLLRKDLKFTGIILTDDMSMRAIKNYSGSADPAVLAVLAGNDMLVLSNYESAYTAILAAVHEGEIPGSTIDCAVFRILSWKLARGIISGE